MFTPSLSEINHNFELFHRHVAVRNKKNRIDNIQLFEKKLIIISIGCSNSDCFPSGCNIFFENYTKFEGFHGPRVQGCSVKKKKFSLGISF